VTYISDFQFLVVSIAFWQIPNVAFR